MILPLHINPGVLIPQRKRKFGAVPCSFNLIERRRVMRRRAISRPREPVESKVERFQNVFVRIALRQLFSNEIADLISRPLERLAEQYFLVHNIYSWPELSVAERQLSFSHASNGRRRTGSH